MSDQQLIDAAYDDRTLLTGAVEAIERTIALLDTGQVRVAEKADGEWVVNEWIKKAVLLYFSINALEETSAGPFVDHDKLPTKTSLADQQVRVVPPGTVRYGAFLEPGAVVMPGYVNIGAYVGAGTMVDTWATVGSCAQIGKGVHLSGGVGIGGVLEPAGARPVIVEDGAFIGSRCIITEGAIIGERAVLGANVTITASVPIYDVTGDEKVEYRGYVPPNSIVVPGTRPKEFPGGTVQLACAYIIGHRSDATDEKTSLNDDLRDFGVSV
jgi:2,3,4,5-tetrahydropyridine-2-carboxylate N-succinyltransferase